ncbi:MAG: murein biosynthesis integral membrane protein MurJ, partial [Pseudomonadota bacterium]
DFARVAFPYIIFISLAALFSGVLNATGRFAAAAAAPVLLNVMLITAMSAAWFLGGSVANALIWTIPFAGVAQLALVWRATNQTGLRIRPVRPRWTPAMSRLVRIALPAALAGGVVQINLLVGQIVASNTEKAVSWLYSADRLYQLPLGVVGIAVGIVLLPDLSRRLADGDGKGAQEAYSRAAEISLALTVPCAVALCVIPLPLVSVLFERGAFGTDDTAATALAVTVYGLGLPAFVLQKTVQPLFFAREDTKRPFHYAVVAMIINAAVAVGLSYTIGWIAAAIAATLAGWAMLWLLMRGAKGFGEEARLDARCRSRIWRIVVASLIMGGVLLGLSVLMAPFFGISGWRWLALIVLLGLGALSYFISGKLLGAFKIAELKAALRRNSA